MARHLVPDRRDRTEAVAFHLLLQALRLFSPSGGRRAGRFLGRCVARWVPVRRDVALANLRASFPERTEAERRAIYRGMCENMGVTLAEFARFGAARPEPVSSWVRMENAEAVERALQAGRGALLVTAHFGNWEALGVAMAARGYPMTALVARQRNPLVESLFTAYRGRVGLPSINVGNSLKPLLRVLREGSCVATLADQDGGPHGFFLPFLGRPASVQSGLFSLLARKGTPMVTGFAIREGDGWRGEIQDPVFPIADGDPETEARRLAAIYIQRVETYVRRHPDHWFWLHRRWRTQPPLA
jgi:Kdo2-lipid IVA lauroyltransferase/acyltransferase